MEKSAAGEWPWYSDQHQRQTTGKLPGVDATHVLDTVLSVLPLERCALVRPHRPGIRCGGDRRNPAVRQYSAEKGWGAVLKKMLLFL